MNRIRASMQRIESLGRAAAAKDESLLHEALQDFMEDQPDEVIPMLCKLILEDWHEEHEDLALMLQWARDPRAVEPLKISAQTRHAHLLKWNNLNEFQRKCTWALADIGTEEAKQALLQLSQKHDEPVSKYALERLQGWESELGRKGKGS